MNTRDFLLSILLSAIFVTACPGRLDTDAAFTESHPNPLAFSAVDVYGRPIRVGIPSNNVWVMIFSAEATSDAMQPITANIATHFYDEESLSFLTVVDLRNLAFYKRPFAPRAIRDAGDRTVARVNRQLENQGLEPIEALGDHLFLITDNNGEITDRYGVPDPSQTLTIIIFDPNGMELGRFDPEKDIDSVFAAIERGMNILTQRGEISAAN